MSGSQGYFARNVSDESIEADRWRWSHSCVPAPESEPPRPSLARSLVDHPTFDENAEEKEVVAVVPPGEGDSDGGESGAPQRLVDKHNNLFVLARPSGLLRQLVFYEDKTLLMDIVVLLVATSLGALVAAALKQPVIIAYLLAGMVVGPGGLDLIEELVQIETFSKLGLVLLLFLLGVEFSISSLRGSRGASPVLASVLGVGASAGERGRGRS